MIRVAHLVTRLDFGGAQQNTLYTAGHLDPARFDVSVVCGRGGLLDEEALRSSAALPRPFRLFFLPSLVREISLLRDLRAFFQLISWLRRERPHVVHTHSSKAGVLGRLAARAAGVPVIVHTYHGFGFHERQSAVVRGFYTAIERLCVSASDWTLFVSEDNRRWAERLGLARGGPDPGRGGRCSILRSGVKLSELPARLADRGRKKEELGFSARAPLVVSVGNLKAQKNPEAFVRLAARCLDSFPDARFLFVGDGELRPRVEAQLAASGLGGKVLFPGWRKDTAEILAAADVFVLSSLWEGLPRALVEAMKTGLPCVCYAAGGVRDVLKDGENGFVVEPGDEAALAERVASLLREPARAAEVGRRAAASVGDEFDIDAMVRAQESLYLRLLGEKGLAPV